MGGGKKWVEGPIAQVLYANQILPGAKECYAGLLAVIDYAKNPPATQPPTPAPPRSCNPAFSTGPDRDDDCVCNRGLTCSTGGSRGCAFSGSGNSTRYFKPTCGAPCVCK